MEAVTITQVLGDEAVRLVGTSRRSDQAHPVPPWRIVGVRSAICLRPSPGLPPHRNDLVQLDRSIRLQQWGNFDRPTFGLN
jgi:hypothetical protein